MINKTLILLRGLPGAGKSTFAKLLGEGIFEADQYFYDKEGNYKFDTSKLHEAHKWCQNEVENVMIESKLDKYNFNNFKGEINSTIIVSNTSTTEKELKPYLDLAKKYDYKVISLIVENRHGNLSIHNVPKETIDKMRNRFSIKL